MSDCGLGATPARLAPRLHSLPLYLLYSPFVPYSAWPTSRPRPVLMRLEGDSCGAQATQRRAVMATCPSVCPRSRSWDPSSSWNQVLPFCFIFIIGSISYSSVPCCWSWLPVWYISRQDLCSSRHLPYCGQRANHPGSHPHLSPLRPL